MCSAPMLRAEAIPIIRARIIITEPIDPAFIVATTTVVITIMATTILTGITPGFMDGRTTHGRVRSPGVWAPGDGADRRGGATTAAGGHLTPIMRHPLFGSRIT